MREFFKRLFCRHGEGKVWQIVAINWDGVTVVKCSKCGAIKHVPL